MKTWTRPEFEELTMNAEIGAYQPDEDDREPPPVIAPGAVPETRLAETRLAEPNASSQRATLHDG
jgi:hypothetical protein